MKKHRSLPAGLAAPRSAGIIAAPKRELAV